jgi:uncharacterized membrane protein YjgN (DUF898 family)
VIGLAAFLYSITQRFSPYLSIVIALVASVVMPYLIYQSLRFMASNSSYRNIRFRFHGSLKQSYIEYFLFPILIFLTGGIVFPYIQFRQHTYLMDHAAYGTSRSVFKGNSSHYYGVYIRAFLISFGLYLVLIVVGVGFFLSVRNSSIGIPSSNPLAFMGILIPVYAVLLLLGAVLQQYVYVNIHNYMFKEAGVPGKIRFVSTLDTWAMVKLQVVNLLAIIFSLGLLSPWAKVRRTQYVLSQMMVVSNGGLEDVMADVAESQNAIGDAATDYFNVDFGL